LQRDRREEKRNEDGKQSDDAVLRKAVREMRRPSALTKSDPLLLG
jgi:hypothetical protein